VDEPGELSLMPPYLASLSPLSCGLLGWLVTASSHYPRQCEALCTRCAPLAVGVTSAPFGSLSGENALDARVLAGVGHRGASHSSRHGPVERVCA
jgi:hypothetical protein